MTYDAEREASAFVDRYGEIGEVVLAAFQTADPLDAVTVAYRRAALNLSIWAVVGQLLPELDRLARERKF